MSIEEKTICNVQEKTICNVQLAIVIEAPTPDYKCEASL